MRTIIACDNGPRASCLNSLNAIALALSCLAKVSLNLNHHLWLYPVKTTVPTYVQTRNDLALPSNSRDCLNEFERRQFWLDDRPFVETSRLVGIFSSPVGLSSTTRRLSLESLSLLKNDIKEKKNSKVLYWALWPLCWAFMTTHKVEWWIHRWLVRR